MRFKVTIVLAFFFLAAGVWFFYQAAATASRGGEDAPLYSTERHDPYGTAAIKDLLLEHGAAASALLLPTPEPSVGATLIQVLTEDHAAFSRMPRIQTNRLKDWIASGNTLIQFTRVQTDLMSDTGLLVTDHVDHLSDVEAGEAHGKSQKEISEVEEPVEWIGAPSQSGHVLPIRHRLLAVYSPSTLAPSTSATMPTTRASAHPAESAWRPLLVKANTKEWIAAVRPFGSGRIIVVGAQTPILNRTLEIDDNLDFVLGLLPPPEKFGTKPILFDEWSHGIGHEGTLIGFIHQVGLFPMLFQLFFVVALYVWATSGFHPSDAARAKRRRSAGEQIDTLGYLYSQSMKSGAVFEKVHAEVRRRIAGLLRCSPAAIENTLPQVPPQLAARVREILNHLEQVGRGHGPTCPSCGYDLTRNSTGTCPECGAAIHWTIKDRIARADGLADLPEQKTQSSKRIEGRLAAILTESYQLSEEFARVRNRIA